MKSKDIFVQIDENGQIKIEDILKAINLYNRHKAKEERESELEYIKRQKEKENESKKNP